MFEPLRRFVLSLLRVPPAPEPPLGAPDSVRVFRAGRNYYKLQLLRWGIAQAGAVMGILFSVTLLAWFRSEVNAVQLARAPSAAPAFAPTPAVVTPAGPSPPTPAAPRPRARPQRSRGLNRQDLRYLAPRTPPWVVVILELFECGGILLFLAQVPVTYAAVRLEFEQHWYIVTDRSLRIRIGLFRLRESTMSFANLQQVEVKQGPLQRLLGLADVRVESAGGGTHHDERPGRESLHTGIFHSVDNAAEIRDLILARLRKFRETGLGDPDDRNPASPTPAPADPSRPDALAAAREVLAEARALRQALS